MVATDATGDGLRRSTVECPCAAEEVTVESSQNDGDEMILISRHPSSACSQRFNPVLSGFAVQVDRGLGDIILQLAIPFGSR